MTTPHTLRKSGHKARAAMTAAALAAMALAGLPALAQGTSAETATTTTKPGGTAVLQPAEQTPGKAQGSKPGTGQFAQEDLDMMEDIAEANLAEIETGKLALEKAQSPAVKKFAQQMVDDHTKALKDLQQIASKKGASLPQETDLQHKTVATALSALSGNVFDKQYVQQVGVTDHQRTAELLQTVQKTGQDAGLKAYAAKMLPKVQGHLKMAQAMVSKMK